jgi:thioredoxin-related protein
MPARVIPLAIMVLIAIAPLSRGQAVPHAERPARPASAMKLIVIEVPGCFYCRLFRRDVLPLYEASPRAREIPMLVLDLKTAKARKLAFARPINVLPTVVVFRAGKEIGRIPGYMAPDIFFRSINYLLSRKD